MLSITSVSNEKIKLYRKLSRSAKERRSAGLFVTEGVRITADAAEGSFLRAVFVTEKCLEKYSDVFSHILADAGGRTYIITEEISKYLSDTNAPQGVYAICSCPPDLSPENTVKSGGKYIVLTDMQDPGNMGTVIRTADACGIDGVICCDCCDIYNLKTVRSAMGSILHINISVSDEDSVFRALSEKNITSYAAVVSGYDRLITECSFSSGAAVFIGNEGRGLSPETSERCDIRMTVPMKGRANSLNAAAAAGIIMWELTK